MKLSTFLGLAILFAVCNAMPKDPAPAHAEKGEQWRSLLDNPLANLNKALKLEKSIKDVVSSMHDMKHLPWKNPLTHPELRNKKNE